MVARKNVLTSGVGLFVLAATLKFTSFFEGENHYVYTGRQAWCCYWCGLRFCLCLYRAV